MSATVTGNFEEYMRMAWPDVPRDSYIWETMEVIWNSAYVSAINTFDSVLGALDEERGANYIQQLLEESKTHVDAFIQREYKRQSMIKRSPHAH